MHHAAKPPDTTHMVPPSLAKPPARNGAHPTPSATTQAVSVPARAAARATILAAASFAAGPSGEAAGVPTRARVHRREAGVHVVPRLA